MRAIFPLAIIAMAAVACNAAPTEVFAPVAGPAPSGLPVTLGITPSTATPFAGPPIAADGDSLVATAEYEVTGCLDYAATAGLSDGVLVVTITEKTPATVRYCALGKGTAVFRAVVRPAPRGVFAVVLRQRLELANDSPVERELARGSASFP